MQGWAHSVAGHLMGVPPITPAEVQRTGDPEARPAAPGWIPLLLGAVDGHLDHEAGVDSAPSTTTGPKARESALC